jgi:NAD-specific glutamate dehydrogenase
MFLVIGNDFRGFHIRFRDVARGGIRIVMSRGKEAYSINQRTLFDENYGLASTQNLKNKDIPEGGAKGTILPEYVFFFALLLRLEIEADWDIGLELSRGFASRSMSM